jgi:hypothetical protein
MSISLHFQLFKLYFNCKIVPIPTFILPPSVIKFHSTLNIFKILVGQQSFLRFQKIMFSNYSFTEGKGTSYLLSYYTPTLESKENKGIFSVSYSTILDINL